MSYNIDYPGLKNKHIVCVILSAILLLLPGCGSLVDVPVVDTICEPQAVIDGAANISLFLNITRPGARRNIVVKLDSVELLVDDLWVLAAADITVINNVEDVSTQKFIGRQWLKGKFCRGVRVNVAGAALVTDAGERPLSIINPESEIIFQNPFELDPGSRKVVMIEWDPDKSLSAAGFEGMALKAFQSGHARVTTNLVYVVCPEIDTVYVVSIDNFLVVDAFPVTGHPEYVAVDSITKKIHILLPAQNKINSYDIFTHLTTSDIQVPLVNSSVYMTVNSHSQIAYILDAQGVLTSVDLVSGNLLNRTRVGNQPNYLYYIPGLEKVAVSSTIDQAVYLVNPDNLSIDDIISLGAVPAGMVSWGDYLYIAVGNANSISVYDLSARKLVKNFHVGLSPFRLVADDNSVYVTNLIDGTLSVIQGGQLNVSKDVSIGKSAREIGLAPRHRLLFVGEGNCNGSLAVVDTTGNHVIGRVELGAKPVGIAVLE